MVPARSTLTDNESTVCAHRNTLEVIGKSGGNTAQEQGEAHITVVSPPEFTGVLSKVLTIPINRTTGLRIQTSASKQCVGRAQVVLEGKTEQTYRRGYNPNPTLFAAQFSKYCTKGGEPSLWDPEHFYPHITVSFYEARPPEEGQRCSQRAQTRASWGLLVVHTCLKWAHYAHKPLLFDASSVQPRPPRCALASGQFLKMFRLTPEGKF